MAINTKSNNIYVFPTANRPYHDPAGRLTTEYNLTSILNRLLDTKGFVITKGNIGTTENNNRYKQLPLISGPKPNITEGPPIEFEFNIHGYFFHLIDIREIFSQSTSLNPIEGNELIAVLHLSQSSAQAQAGGQDSYKNQVLQTIDGGDNKGESATPSANDSYEGLKFYFTQNGVNSGILTELGSNNAVDLNTDDTYWLSLLTYREEGGDYANNGWYITEDSKIRFRTTSTNGEYSLRSISIDDGELT